MTSAPPTHAERLFTLSLDLMVVKNATTHRWTHVNPQVIRTLGYTEQELTSQSSMNFIHPEDRVQTMNRALEVPSTGTIQNFENRYVSRDGRVVWLSWTAVFEPTENLVYAVAKDITLTKAQEELIAAQKMEFATASKLNSLGRFAAGIAHEVNNPLTIVYAQTCKLRKLISKPEFQHEEILKITEQIESTTARIVRIVSGLKSFTRQTSNDSFERANVADILNDTLTFCRRNFADQDIDLTVQEIPKGIFVFAHPVQISQVLINLLNNAFDAVLEAPQKWIRITTQARDAWVEIRVTDSGAGIPFEKRPKLFQAFFTTKSIGNGTGLGLNIAKMILTSHGGEIIFEDTAPHTTFLVRLPLVK